MYFFFPSDTLESTQQVHSRQCLLNEQTKEIRDCQFISRISLANTFQISSLAKQKQRNVINSINKI